jgi:hypothetical protein
MSLIRLDFGAGVLSHLKSHHTHDDSVFDTLRVIVQGWQFEASFEPSSATPDSELCCRYSQSFSTMPRRPPTPSSTANNQGRVEISP